MPWGRNSASCKVPGTQTIPSTDDAFKHTSLTSGMMIDTSVSVFVIIFNARLRIQGPFASSFVMITCPFSFAAHDTRCPGLKKLSTTWTVANCQSSTILAPKFSTRFLTSSLSIHKNVCLCQSEWHVTSLALVALIIWKHSTQMEDGCSALISKMETCDEQIPAPTDCFFSPWLHAVATF